MRTYFRRCHVCLNLNVAIGKRIDQCRRCHAELTPFYYFDDFEIEPYFEHKIELAFHEPLVQEEEEGGDVEFSPLVGLSFFW